MSISLSNPYLEKDAIRAPNFFNGRLLSAEDLSAERAAMRRMLAQLGRATGDGIAYGLEVTGAIGGNTVTDPVVTVSAGLAINREGEAIELSQAVDVSLRQPSSAGTASTAPPVGKNGAFGPCGVLAASAYAAGKGVYLLTIAPTEGREGRAPVSGLGSLNACCGDKSIVEGIEFRLIRIDVSASDLNDDRLRNRLAHRCFGSAESGFAGFFAHPFGIVSDSYGLVDGLRNGQLQDSEVPLALIHWTDTGGTRFVEQWAVRRRVIQAAPVGRWSNALGDRRVAEREAMFQQFQAEVEESSASSAGSIQATQRFDYLPAVGFLPLAKTSVFLGQDPQRFFAGLTTSNLARIEGARVQALLRRALEFPPIDLTLPDAAQRLIWVYLVRESLQAGTGADAPKPYLVFVSGQVPYAAEPHYNVNAWDFANFA
jgi:hypothetical protein